MDWVAAFATFSVAACAEGTSTRGFFGMFFSYRLRATGCATSKALWVGFPAQLLAGNRNGLVQLGLRGCARGPTVKRRERGNRPCLSEVVRGANFGFSFHTSSPGWPGSLWANSRYAWLKWTSSSAPIRIGTVMGVALLAAMFSIAACACISRAKGIFGMYFNLGDQKGL